LKVGVVGMGAAGLRTAMLLERAGVDVHLFEARGRPGGRLHTIDEGNGVLYEAGGEWIDADHFRVISLLQEFELEPEARANWPGRVVHKGKQTTEDEIWSDALEDDLRVEAAARELCRSLSLPPWKNIDSKDLDGRTVASFLEEQTRSERGLWWTTAKYRSDEGDDLDKIGLLGWLSGFIHYLDRDGDVMSAYRIPGGARGLCEKILSRLHAPANFGAILLRVRQDANGVTLVFENGEARFDRVVLTLPPPALERVVFEPAATVGKRCAVEACRMSRAVKICWEFSRPWWREEGWGGRMLSDSKVQQTWDGSLGEAPVLSSYICGDVAEEWMSLGDPVRAGIYELGKLCPEAQSTFVRGWTHDWIHDPYARGAFSHLGPGYVLDHMASIATPEGCVHFAGEHTGMWVGFVEGALESAERVTQELLDA
jgi:monoamine oxidase